MDKELEGALTALLGFTPEDLPKAASPLYSYDDGEELVAGMPTFDKRGLVGPLGIPSIMVRSSSKDDSSEDSKATEEEEDAGWGPPSNLLKTLRGFGDDDGDVDEQPWATPPCPAGMEGGGGSNPAIAQVAEAGAHVGEPTAVSQAL